MFITKDVFEWDTMERREFLLSAGGIVGATAIGSVAYTEASVTRNVTVNVDADSSAIIGLSPGNDAKIAGFTDGKLTINTNRDSSNGLNKRGNFTYGTRDSPEFKITNNDEEERSLTVSLDIDKGDLKIHLYDNSDGNSYIDTATTGSDGTVASWGPGNKVNAVLIINTKGMDTGSLTGTITLDAT